MRQEKAKIFLADDRGFDQTNWSESRHTFSYGKYFNEYKQPFGNIYAVNDEVLDAGQSISISIDRNSHVILLPVIGAIEFKDPGGQSQLLAAGQLQLVTMEGGEAIVIQNPFTEGLVNFLQIGIRAGSSIVKRNSAISNYDVNSSPNALVKILSAEQEKSCDQFTVSIGKFDGRSEAIHKAADNKNGVFVFVIEGAFEVQGTLLHARDGLALWDTNEIEMEALSNGAIVLLIESH